MGKGPLVQRVACPYMPLERGGNPPATYPPRAYTQQLVRGTTEPWKKVRDAPVTSWQEGPGETQRPPPSNGPRQRKTDYAATAAGPPSRTATEVT